MINKDIDKSFLFCCYGRNNQQSLLTILGAMFSGVQFCGVNTSYSVLPYVNTERPVFYRERYAGMYASWVYPLAQVQTHTGKMLLTFHLFL